MTAPTPIGLGAVVSDHPLASSAGADVLKEGGNAVDAAVCMAAVLSVVRPHMCGIGGDAFALFFEAETGAVHALNGSGRSGTLATPEAYARGVGSHRGPTGSAHVTVPGAVAAWEDAAARLGSRSLARLLAPAIELAREGFPVSLRLAEELAGYLDLHPSDPPGHFFVDGVAPPMGDRIRNRALAGTLEAIAADGARGFYDGFVAESLVDYLAAHGGHVTRADLDAHRSSWVSPLSGTHFGHTFFAMPPNTQGMALLQQLGMAEALGLHSMERESPELLHALIEAKKISFADRDRWVCDPAFHEAPMEQMLDPAYVARRAALVSEDHAVASYEAGIGLRTSGYRAPSSSAGDTVYLTAVDAWGNAVSWIQSIYSEFGSGLMDPATGVLLHNRGALFTLVADHPNRVEPGKRPFHTLSPSLALRDGRFAFTFGTPGGHAQTQTLTQVALSHLVFAMSLQDAVDAPRFRSGDGLDVAIESRIPMATVDALEARGHRVQRVVAWEGAMGSAQMIGRGESPAHLECAADPRREAWAEVL